ncbi:hypothetical protein AAE478_009212 [Parahypoxylon ruwenzoriense]
MSAPPASTPMTNEMPSVSTEPPLGTDQRANAKRRFYRIVEHFDAGNNDDGNPYSRSRLIRYTYEYAISEVSQDNFLRAFFRAMALSIDEDEDTDNFEPPRSGFFDFAEYLLDNFFLPLKASAKKTPQPSPAYHSPVRGGHGGAQGFFGTLDRVSALRGACLVRDRHRCVISRKFDQAEAVIRFDRADNEARDDDETLLIEDPKPFDVLEDPSPSKEAALAVLNMLDNGLTHLIEGADIDKPHNAITLTHSLRNFFGDFKIFFEPLLDQQPHTYRIDSFLPRHIFRDPALPITRTLYYLTNTWTIDPPSPRLLAVHRAIAHILHLSAAGDYIDRLLRDMDEEGIQADGSTELNRLINLRLGGWLGSTALPRQ